MNSSIPCATLAAVLACAPLTSVLADGDEVSMYQHTTVPNVRQPRDRLITGGQPDAAAWTQLAAQGVSTVINLRPPAEMGERDEGTEVAAAGLAYREVPVAGADDITEAKGRELWSLLQRESGTVLVHCASGNRVGALIAIGAAKAGGIAPQAALELGKASGLTGAESRVRELLDLPAAE
jgi:uncharacterized protein (TIGR01244 family)